MSFKKATTWSFVFLMIAGLFQACKSTKDASDKLSNSDLASDKDYTLEKSLLWKIDGNGLAQPSYLYGTIHLIDSESFFWPKGTLAAIDESEDIVFEIDLDDMFDISASMSLLTKAFMKDGKTLKDLYSAEDYKFVKEHFEGMGLPMFMMQKLKPMFLTVFASGDVKMGEGFGAGSGTKSYEMEIYDIAQNSSKEVSGLETMEYQMSVFDSIPYQEQADMLLQTIKTSDMEDNSFKEMMAMYTNQDINKMVESMGEEEGIGGYEDILLYNRNKNWIPVMKKMMMSKKIFFAVGAGHLGGKDGVIDLLKKEGFKLTPLSTASE